MNDIDSTPGGVRRVPFVGLTGPSRALVAPPRSPATRPATRRSAPRALLHGAFSRFAALHGLAKVRVGVNLVPQYHAPD